MLQQQQQQLLFHTLQLNRTKDPREESNYISPTFVQERPSGGHRPDSTYESIHVFNRTMPSASAGNTMPVPSTMQSGMSSASTMPVPHSVLRQVEEDPYNASQSSSSTYTNPLKYFVLDKNLVNQNND